jgi:hypothetical protein
MARGRRQFEHYATRVTCVLSAALIAWSILHGKGLAYAFYSSQNWWITFVFLFVADVGNGFAVDVGRSRPLEDRWGMLLMTGCFVAQALLVLSGHPETDPPG